MKIALLQLDTLWEDKAANLENVTELIGSLPDDVDLVVLPEMFTTGFSMNPQLIDEVESRNSLLITQSISAKYHMLNVGKCIIIEHQCYYFLLYFFFPDCIY